MRKYRFTCIVTAVCMVFWGSTVFGQGVIRGIIKDKDSGEPLISANILVKSTGEGTVTDFDGKFSLNTTAKFPLQVTASYVGYLDKTLDVSSSGQILTIELESDVVTISAVEVEGRRLSEKQAQ